MKKTIMILLGGMILFSIGGCEQDDDATWTEVKDVTLSGAMSTSGSTTALTGLVNGQTTPVDPTQYSLYCVTFSNPPISGTGNFAADGAYSVTLTDAAGLPVGCFINDAANKPVATLTFEVGAGDEFDDGTTSGRT